MAWQDRIQRQNEFRAMQAERQAIREQQDAIRQQELERRNELNRMIMEGYTPGQDVPFEDEQADVMYNALSEPERAQMPEFQGSAPDLVESRTPSQFDINKSYEAMIRGERGLDALAMQQAAAKTRATTQAPSSVREWEAFSKMPPKMQEKYLTMKRASQYQTIGGVPTQMTPSGAPVPLSTLEKESGAQRELAASRKEGAELGAARSELAEIQANLPRLETVVGQLSALGKKATYTQAGQAADITTRQLGLPVSEGAIARKEYISKVDNEVLPLLKQTFGAAFTQKEGESLKATLGDVNASPEEKDAVLRSFIDSKRAQLETKMRRAMGQAREQAGITEAGQVKVKVGDIVTKGGNKYIVRSVDKNGVPIDVDPAR